MAQHDDTFRMNPVTLGALIGGVVAFIAVGAIVDVLWVLIGIAIGSGIGFGVRRLARDAAVYSDAVELSEATTRDELYHLAQDLGIDGRSSMNRDQLAEAVARRHGEA